MAGGHETVWANDYLDLKKPFWHSWQDIAATMPAGSNRSKLLGGDVLQWTDNYCATFQCGAWSNVGSWRPADPPAADLFPSPARDPEFIRSISAMVWPRAAVAAGSYWRYDGGLDINGSRFRALYARLNDRVLRGRGVASCPTGCECNETAACGVAYPAPGEHLRGGFVQG